MAFKIQGKIIKWLMEGDPSIRWQVLRDLADADPREIENEREKILKAGWGKKLLSYQMPSGLWADSLYSRKWISTTYTMLLLKILGLSPKNAQAQKSCNVLLEKGRFPDGGINYIKTYKQSETCITGMVLSILSYFNFHPEKLTDLIRYLLREQMDDGGWNCQA
jgi:hypothetical protein